MSVTFYPVAVCDGRGRCIGDGFNVSNSNAGLLLSSLGLDAGEDLCGECRIEVFINLCRAWLKANLNRRSLEIQASRDGNFIDCGVRPGYVNERLHELAILATAARDGEGATSIRWA